MASTRFDPKLRRILCGLERAEVTAIGNRF
jgi:hypothetical protein